MIRQHVPVGWIDMSRRSLHNQVKTWKPSADANPENKILSTNEDASCKTLSVLWKFLQQQQAPEVDLDCFDINPLNYHYYMALFCEVPYSGSAKHRKLKNQSLIQSITEVPYVNKTRHFSQKRALKISPPPIQIFF